MYFYEKDCTFGSNGIDFIGIYEKIFLEAAKWLQEYFFNSRFI